MAVQEGFLEEVASDGLPVLGCLVQATSICLQCTAGSTRSCKPCRWNCRAPSTS